MQLLVPGICTMQRWKLCEAAVKNNARTSAMMCGHLQDPFSQTVTTASLSQWKSIRFRCQKTPQVEHAMRTAYISRQVMEYRRRWGGQGKLNQRPSQ